MIPKYLPFVITVFLPLTFSAPTPLETPLALISSATPDTELNPSNVILTDSSLPNPTQNTTWPSPPDDVPVIPTFLPQLSSQEGQPVLNWTRVTSSSGGIDHVEVLNQQGVAVTTFDRKAAGSTATGTVVAAAQTSQPPSTRLVPVGTIPFLPSWKLQASK